MTSKNKLGGMNLVRDSRRAVSPVTAQLRNETQKIKSFFKFPRHLVRELEEERSGEENHWNKNKNWSEAGGRELQYSAPSSLE